MLDRHEDMEIIGRRHSYIAKYRVGFSKEGKIDAIEVDLHSNGGDTEDLTDAVSIGITVEEELH